ncbi:MAG: exosortase K [Bacteroidales bacterium]
MKTKNLPFYFLAFGLLISLKFWFAWADNQVLFVLLKPTNAIFSIMTASESAYSPDTGFYHEKFNILIDKSCAGYNFMLINFLMVYVLVLKYVKKPHFKWLLLPLTLAFSLVITVFVNSFRIIASANFQHTIHKMLNVKQEIVHQTIGVITYLSFLIIIYLITEKILARKYEKINES